METIVVKVGGHEVEDRRFLSELASTIKDLETPVVIVHGGGREISMLQEELGIMPRFVDGVRITDEPSLEVAEMVLCGTVNKRLVRYLLIGGVDALGMSGIDRGLIRAERMQHPNQDMGFTGVVTDVRDGILLEMLAQGITPVIAPLCLGHDAIYNVNADHVAGAVASAVNASRVVFLTNVEGVLVNGQVATTLTPEQAEVLIADGTISDGMIPKVRTALEALKGNVPRAVITNLEGLKTHGGTVFTR